MWLNVGSTPYSRLQNKFCIILFSNSFSLILIIKVCVDYPDTSNASMLSSAGINNTFMQGGKKCKYLFFLF